MLGLEHLPGRDGVRGGVEREILSLFRRRVCPCPTHPTCSGSSLLVTSAMPVHNLACIPSFSRFLIVLEKAVMEDEPGRGGFIDGVWGGQVYAWVGLRWLFCNMDKCTFYVLESNLPCCHIPTFTNPVTRSSISLSVNPKNHRPLRLAFILFLITISLREERWSALILTGQ